MRPTLFRVSRVFVRPSPAAIAVCALAVSLAVDRNVLVQAASAGDAHAPAAAASAKSAETGATVEREALVRREGAMTPLYGGARFTFGAFSRGAWRDDDDDDDDGERRNRGGTYRTLCVRLCDGYYFPINFSVTRDRLALDAQACESRCGGQGRLFVHRNPGGSTEDMVDLTGRPYSRLPTAFLYRTKYVPSCTCQPQPWEAASQDRHRAYALAAAARDGDKAALRQLRELQAKLRETASIDSNRPGKRAARDLDERSPVPLETGRPPMTLVREAERLRMSRRPPAREQALTSAASRWSKLQAGPSPIAQ